jgi:hypothetical protein
MSKSLPAQDNPPQADRDSRGRLLPGNKLGKGLAEKANITKRYKKAITSEFQRYGIAAIKREREQNPSKFLDVTTAAYHRKNIEKIGSRARASLLNDAKVIKSVGIPQLPGLLQRIADGECPNDTVRAQLEEWDAA